MRCPDCNQRNSVAARHCQSCGHKFKRKPLSDQLKVAACLALAGIAVWSIGSIVIPNIADPEQNLARVAKQIAAGPKNSEDNKRMQQDFDRAIRKYLTRLGPRPSAEIVKRLEKVLPASAYEVHVMDLPRGLKVVEIDTVLQASEYLMMKGSSGNKVFTLTGLEVFDDARLINESAGPMLVTIGHSGGQPPHHLQVRVYALLPDSISDETEKLLPPISGEGSIRFAKNGRDITLDLSLLSLGQAEKLFTPAPQNDDGVVHQYLEWKDAHYKSRYEYIPSPFAALYAVARCMRYPDLAASHSQFLGAKGEQLVRENKSQDAGDFHARRLSGAPDRARYLLTGNVGSFLIETARTNGTWTIVQAGNAPANIAKQQAQNTPIIAAAPPAKVAVQAPAKIVEKKGPAKIVEKTLDKSIAQPAPPHKMDRSADQQKPKAAVQAEEPKHDRKGKERQPDKKLAEKTQNEKSKADKNKIAEKKQKPEKPKPAAPDKPAVAGKPAQISNRLAANVVNLRLGPSTNAKPVTSVGKGASVDIIGKQNGWYKVRSQGKEGYVYAGLVDYKRPDAYTTATLTKKRAVVDSHKRALGQPQVGDRLVVIGGLENNKYKVQLSNGKTGYVDKDALNVTIEEPQFVP